MGELYTVGADTWQDITWSDAGGQTFIPITPFTWHYLKLYLYKPAEGSALRARIYYADGEHKPFGEVLAVAMFLPKYFPPGVDQSWITRVLQPFKATPIWEYAIVLHQALIAPPSLAAWAYDAGDAAYPRGRRLSSDDRGATWTVHPDDDHLFAIWGEPWAPPPPPLPGLNKWAVMGVVTDYVDDNLRVKAYTDVPCHLTLYYTFKQPWTHREIASRRGLSAPWETYWCYVSWIQVEQEEEGDSETHTFLIPGLVTCQWIWYRFRGTIDGKNSPSDSPIFAKHIVTPITQSFWATQDGRRQWKTAGPPDGYTTAHDAPIAEGSLLDWTYTIGQQYLMGDKYRVFRSGVVFDTSAIPAGSTISSAKIRFHLTSDNSVNDFLLTLVDGKDLDTPMVLSDYGDLLDEVTDGGHFDTFQLQPPPWTFEITFTPYGLTLIKPGGLTKLGLRSSDDILANLPTHIGEHIDIRGGDHPDPAVVPYLTVSYTP